MIVESKILETLLEGLSLRNPTSPPLDHAMPFQAYSPTEGQEYLDISYLPNTTTEVFVGNDTPKWYQGIFQIAVMWPDKGLGVLPARDIASQVAENWKKGPAFDGGSFRLKLPGAPSIAQTLKDGAWLRVPVSIPYQVIA